MLITFDNLSEAISSADAHQAYAIAAELAGNKTLAHKHQRHANEIMFEVMAITKTDCSLSDDELLAELTQ